MLSNRARLIVKTMVLTLLGAGLIGAVIGLIVLRGGFYNIAATAQHYPLIYTVFEEGLQYSVQNHARDIQVPAGLGAAEQVRRGAAIYAANCIQCHGGPGVAPLQQGMSMQPVPGPLVDADLNWETRELYWITRNGIKMSGMPAWEYHLSDNDIWAVVAFVSAMPNMTTEDFRRMTAPGDAPAIATQGDQP
ncbi:c-type cytochrome [Massilia timonae]|uniref:c-type cytochrome n=1 Tax=Massilia timonae TaxID=47229 RepID=UPI00235242D2|nr:cytochrome c [Massilia timonae]